MVRCVRIPPGLNHSIIQEAFGGHGGEVPGEIYNEDYAGRRKEKKRKTIAHVDSPPVSPPPAKIDLGQKLL